MERNTYPESVEPDPKDELTLEMEQNPHLQQLDAQLDKTKAGQEIKAMDEYLDTANEVYATEQGAKMREMPLPSKDELKEPGKR